MGEWKECTIECLGKIITGKTPRTIIPDNYGGEIPFLSPSDNMDVKYVGRTNKTLTSVGVNEVKNCLLPRNSVCVSCIGSDLGKVLVTTEPTVTNQQINSIIVNSENDVDFVYYLMSIIGKNLNYISKTSTAVPIVNKSAFSSYKISVPPLPEQQKIAAILSALDAKIETNRKINARLEELAQALFKSWFIDFEPFAGKMPEDWDNAKVGDVSIINERQYSLTEDWTDFQYLDTGNITDNVLGELQQFSNQSELPSRARRKVKDFDIVYSTVRPNQRHLGLLLNPGRNLLVSTGFAVISAKEYLINPFYLYLVISQRAISDFLQNLGEQATSAYPSITASDIANLEIMLPNLDVQNQFGSIILKFYHQKYYLECECSRLAALRDALLPKLISGELKPE